MTLIFLDGIIAILVFLYIAPPFWTLDVLDILRYPSPHTHLVAIKDLLLRNELFLTVEYHDDLVFVFIVIDLMSHEKK